MEEIQKREGRRDSAKHAKEDLLVGELSGTNKKAGTKDGPGVSVGWFARIKFALRSFRG